VTRNPTTGLKSGGQPCLETLLGLFYDRPEELGRFQQVRRDDLPAAYRTLLAHDHHMTEAVEALHGGPVDVEVLAARQIDARYARKILLHRRADGQVVQFGIVRLDFRFLQPHVQHEIKAAAVPLGRILIEHGVLRTVRLAALWRVTPGVDLCTCFALREPRATYGRTALIYCHAEPAVELLEIVAPI